MCTHIYIIHIFIPYMYSTMRLVINVLHVHTYLQLPCRSCLSTPGLGLGSATMSRQQRSRCGQHAARRTAKAGASDESMRSLTDIAVRARTGTRAFFSRLLVAWIRYFRPEHRIPKKKPTSPDPKSSRPPTWRSGPGTFWSNDFC